MTSRPIASTTRVCTTPPFAMIAGLEGIAMPPVTSPKLDATIWQSGRSASPFIATHLSRQSLTSSSNPITTSSFLPPRTAGPARAWERVPVPAATRGCKIWKRTVGEPGTDAESLQYVLSMAELESQGQGARKRARKIRHVPVWGDARWDVRVEEPRDGSWDLVEARAAVAELQDGLDEDVEQRATQSRTATYPEEKLRWVPRKRHNSRWPVEPTTRHKTTTMVAKLQPLVEFEVPTANIETAAAQHSPQRATDKQMRRRSTRRLSRRVSLAYIEDSSVYVSLVGRRISMVGATPTKSLPASKVATSPRKSFTLLASPSKVLFRPSPSKARSPTRAVQTSPPGPIHEAPEVDDSSLLSAESSILVFDQPVPDVQTKPAHETRRRVSLQNAMRLDRPSTASRRSLDFGTASQQPAPHRRHSFMPPQSNSTSSEIKSRRHTLDVFGENATVTTEMEQDEEMTTGFSSAETTENISEVVVDVCANLDIFGTKSGIARRRKASRASAHSDDEGDTTSSPTSSAHYSSQNVDDSPLPIGLGITHETGVDSQDQAAMLDTSFNAHSDDCDDMAEADTPNKDFWLDDGIGSTPQGRTNDRVADEDEVHQQEEEEDDMFAPHDPEGLSTIFEDEEVFIAQSSPNSQHASDMVEGQDRWSPLVGSEDIVSTDAETMSPTTSAGVDEQTQDSPTAENKSEDSVGEEESQSKEEHNEKMEQSFDFTLVAAEVAQRKASVKPETVRSTIEVSNETTPEHPAMSSSPLSVRSFRDEELLVDGTMVVDDFSVHRTPVRSEPAVSTTEQREEDAVYQEATASPMSVRSFCEDEGTMIVDDFSVHEPSTTEQPADAAVQPAMSSPLSVRSFRDEEALLDGTIVVDDFSVHEPAALQMESKSHQQADDSEHYTIEAVEIASSPRSHIEVASSPAADFDGKDAPASTPPQATATAELVDETETVLNTPTSKGFKPINSDRVSPPVSSSPAKEAEDEDQDEADDLQDEDMGLAMDYEPTVPINMNVDNIAVQEAEPDGEPAAEQEDSETEMLRKFVTRVSANKSAKAAAAALAKRNLRPKRRSGSTGSITSSTGSPVAKSAPTSSDSAAKTTSISSSSDAQKPRFPLGERDANSPSPTKKRKAHHGKSSISGKMSSDDLFKGNEALYSAEISPPRSKRLRSRRKVEAQSDHKTSTSGEPTTEQQSSFSQDMGTSLDSTDAPRRSTRSRNSRVQLKPPAPSANSIALSLIPVRLPGSSGMIMNPTDTSGDKDMPTPIVVSRTARTTAQEKDLAAVTRVNTRKNKAGAVPPKVILSRQAEDPLGFKLKELKGVFDAKEGREGSATTAEEETTTTTTDEKKDGRKSRKSGKSVRWASELVRYNTDLVETPTSPMPAAMALPLVPVRKGARKAEVAVPVPQQPSEDGDGYFPATGTGHENSPPPPPPVAAPVVEEKQDPAAAVPDEKELVKEKDPEPKKSVPTRRTRQSRLQVPTPVSKKILAGGESGAASAAAGLTTPLAILAPTACKATAAAGNGTGVAAPPGSVVKMATRRTKIASLGMGVNGTPAPKRRTRA
ncbi:hypothetical protein GE09DRAFT_1069341 [Coniochaeta sp. 2T2.1]|nr:hypothetical protein GE09DRAFT_1069341 [Coniochaeta sp. 2T2.1]